MKKLLVFILLFLSSKVLSCGYTPYGEDVRYSLFNPKYFDYQMFAPYYYTNYLWGYNTVTNEFQDKLDYYSNIYDWYYYCNKQVSMEAISELTDQFRLTDIQPESSNQFLQYLYKNKKKDVIEYFKFSKKCEDYNTYYQEDVWERNDKQYKIGVEKFINEINNKYATEKDEYLKRKYAFQIIRLTYYNDNHILLRQVFENQFINSKKDYIYYWSLYFYCMTSPNNGNFNAIADIFANCPEKAFATQFYFRDKFNLKTALSFATNQNDIAAIHGYAAAREIGQSLKSLEQIYAHKPNFKLLDFLLLREINKIEDWVYTPYYTNYSPSLEEDGYNFEEDESFVTTQTLRNRSEKDRLYAQEVLNFVNRVNFSKVNNKTLWKAAKIQLLFITRQFDQALKDIENFENQYKDEKILKELQQIKALCIVSKQPFGKAYMTNTVKQIVEQNLADDRFLFALGRELEYKRNLLQGIALISYCENKEMYDATDVEWRGNRLTTTRNLNVFYNYFDYLDFVYTANDLKIILEDLEKQPKDNFTNTLFHNLYKDKNYLTDLLGTKYIREDKLIQALKTFKSLPQTYWQNNYNAWERDKYNEQMCFDENPFYKIKHTPNFIKPREHFFVNKLSVTEHLVKYLALVESPQCKQRDYYYFLVANCYLNMTDFGNSWMMRRFESHATYFQEEYVNESYIDNLEYRKRIMTIKFYEKAYQTSKSDKFKALCLHMINFCQDYQEKNNRLKTEFPQYNEDLSNCSNLEEYFNSRG